jgi:ABC-2 type transport system permease protein
MLLLGLLTLIFGDVGKEGQINFPIALVNMDQAPSRSMDFSALVESVFQQVSKTEQDTTQAVFSLAQPTVGEDKSAFVKQSIDAVRLGDLSALILIPEGFNQKLMSRLADQSTNPLVDVTVYYDQGNTGSEMALSIIEQILSRLEREMLSLAGEFDSQEAIPLETNWLRGDVHEFSYVNFLLPGVILMSFFTAGLFGVPEEVLLARDRHILRRYWVTPLSIPSYIAGFSVGHVVLCIIQFFFLYLLGRLVLGASLNFCQLLPITFLLLSSVAFLSFGFLIASLAKTANAGMAIANILNMPMLFLGGLFFPLGNLPAALKAVTLVNPLTYLAHGLRVSLGVETAVISWPVTVGVPLAWIAICIFITSRKLAWDVGR